MLKFFFFGNHKESSIIKVLMKQKVHIENKIYHKLIPERKITVKLDININSPVPKSGCFITNEKGIIKIKIEKNNFKILLLLRK